MYGFVIVSVQLKCYNNTIVIVLYEEYGIKGYFLLYFLTNIYRFICKLYSKSDKYSVQKFLGSSRKSNKMLEFPNHCNNIFWLRESHKLSRGIKMAIHDLESSTSYWIIFLCVFVRKLNLGNV